MANEESDKTPPVQGEGDYVSARKFDEDEAKFVKSGAVEKKAREAEEAMEGAEGEELEKARRAAADGRSVPGRKDGGG
ncbi:MAG: hypothetical protein ACYC8V_09645 [Caulobacteraceae bacterium]